MLPGVLFAELKTIITAAFLDCGRNVCVGYDVGTAKICCAGQSNIVLEPEGFHYENLSKQNVEMLDCESLTFFDFNIYLSECRKELENPACDSYNLEVATFFNNLQLLIQSVNKYLIDQNMLMRFMGVTQTDTDGGCVTYSVKYSVLTCEIDCDSIQIIEDDIRGL